MAKYGDYERVAREQNIGGGDWFKFKDGNTTVRFATELEEYASHYNKALKKNETCEGEFCEHCFKKDIKRRVQFVGWILDRTDGIFKLVSVGWSIFKQIGEYAVSEEWGFSDVPGYDMVIKKTGTGLGTEYTVMPTNKTTSMTPEQDEQFRGLTDPKDIVAKLKEKYPGSRLEKPMKKTVDDTDIPIIGEKDGDSESINPDDLPF